MKSSVQERKENFIYERKAKKDNGIDDIVCYDNYDNAADYLGE